MVFDIAALQQRRSWLCTMEDSKDKFIADLISNLTELSDNLVAERGEVENQKRLVAAFKEDLSIARKEIKELQRAQRRLNFVSVLVDWDGMNVSRRPLHVERLLTDPFSRYNGGREAARCLMQSVEEHVQNVDPKTDPNTSYKIRGSNMERTLCDFVDAGNGKECADAKLQAQLAQDMADVHCQRVVFCASTDNGYARPDVLGRHRGSDRISLVEGPPFATEMRQLAENFETTTFQRVFMSKKLKPARKVSFGETSTITPPRTPISNYASAAKTSPAQSTTPATAQGMNKPTKLQAACFNAKGHRVDRPLRTSSKDTVNALKRKKLCNPFHILGSCPYSNYSKCSHEHGPVLSLQERIDLMSIARLCVCSSGLLCDNPKCIYGHRCPWENCDGQDCRFSEEMHGVDTRIVREIV
ncbi:hypothetical protein BJX65DRAFT_294679 [Aspergillus insuetus]